MPSSDSVRPEPAVEGAFVGSRVHVRRHPAIVYALVAVLTGALAGCGGSLASKPSATTGGGSSPSSSTASMAEGADSGASTSNDSKSAGTKTGTSNERLTNVARQSVTDVPLLHNYAVGLSRGSLPGPLIAKQAATMEKRFKSGAKTASAAGDGGDTQVLATALTQYAHLAGKLHLAANASEPLPDGFRGDLAAADTSWRSALEAIGRNAHVNLIAGVPELLMPVETSKTAHTTDSHS